MGKLTQREKVLLKERGVVNTSKPTQRDKAVLKELGSYENKVNYLRNTNRSEALRTELITEPSTKRFVELTDSIAKNNPSALIGAKNADDLAQNVTGEDIKDNSRYGYAMVRGKRVKVPMMTNSYGSLLTNSQGDYVGAGGLPVTPVNEASENEIIRVMDAVQSTDYGEKANNYIKILSDKNNSLNNGKILTTPTEIPEFNKRDKSKIKKNFILPDKVPISYRK